jgi:transposase
VQLATQPGVAKSQVATKLGINANLLDRWCKDYLTNGGAAFPGHGKPRDEEMARLKRELARVKKKRDFSREAASFFARESK